MCDDLKVNVESFASHITNLIAKYYDLTQPILEILSKYNHMTIILRYSRSTKTDIFTKEIVREFRSVQPCRSLNYTEPCLRFNEFLNFVREMIESVLHENLEFMKSDILVFDEFVFQNHDQGLNEVVSLYFDVKIVDDDLCVL